MENWQRLVIFIFALLLAAGLDYTGRGMHQSLGGDKQFYIFILPDIQNHRVILFGRSYEEYQAAAVWGRLSGFTSACASELAHGEYQAASLGDQGRAAVSEILPARPLLPARLLSPWSRAWSSLTDLAGPAAALIKYLAFNLKDILLTVWYRLRDLGLPLCQQSGAELRAVWYRLRDSGLSARLMHPGYPL